MMTIQRQPSKNKRLPLQQLVNNPSTTINLSSQLMC